jgi:hypothetical protein
MLVSCRLTSGLQRQTLVVYAAKGFGAGKTKKAGKVGQPVWDCEQQQQWGQQQQQLNGNSTTWL